MFTRNIILSAFLLVEFCFFADTYRLTSKNANNINSIDALVTDEFKTDKTEISVTSVEINPEITTPSSERLSKDTSWEILWKDDFDGPEGALPSTDEWIFDIGYSYPGKRELHWGNNEAQYYTNEPDNVCTDGKGNLRITPLRDANGNWTSARIETKRTDFRPPEGGKMAIEGRIQMPNVVGESAQGYWPAFWSLGSPFRGKYNNWPEIGEFDIMENVNGLDSVWGVLHCGISPGGPCNEKTGLGVRRPCPGSTCQSSFHTYRFEWDDSKTPKELRWYVDGEQYNSVTSDRIDETFWNKMTNHSGYFILLNVAIGGTFPDALSQHVKTPTELTEPGHSMLIDYVTVYTSKT